MKANSLMDLWEENLALKQEVGQLKSAIALGQENCDAEYNRLREEKKRAEKAMVDALREQIEFWEQVPPGIDYDADPENLSPVDAVAHLAGLAVKRANELINQTKL